MRLIVTRPQREALLWQAELQARGHQAWVLPLIDVGPVADTAALRLAWQQLPQYQAMMLVSANAVHNFFQENWHVDPVNIASTAPKLRVWATGPGTVAALLAAGVARHSIDAPAPDTVQFDSEALWQGVAQQVQPGSRVLIVRGADSPGLSSAGPGLGRDWLAQQLSQAGASVQTCVAYQRAAPAFTAAQLAQARQAASDGACWVFSSSEAVHNLCAALPQQDWSAARAVATHRRIAQAARAAGFGVVCESRATLADVLASIESMA